LVEFSHSGYLHQRLSLVAFPPGFNLVLTPETQQRILGVGTDSGTSKQATIEASVSDTLDAHCKMNSHLVFNCFTVGLVLWKELRDQFVEGLHMVGVVGVVEFSERIFLNELIVVCLEK
jgi:hypothetical protein